MEYNCKECEGFWKDMLMDILYAVGTDNAYLIKLYCPKCKRTKREW
jgi:hypothetical protein